MAFYVTLIVFLKIYICQWFRIQAKRNYKCCQTMIAEVQCCIWAFSLINTYLWDHKYFEVQKVNVVWKAVKHSKQPARS